MLIKRNESGRFLVGYMVKSLCYRVLSFCCASGDSVPVVLCVTLNLSQHTTLLQGCSKSCYVFNILYIIMLIKYYMFVGCHWDEYICSSNISDNGRTYRHRASDYANLLRVVPCNPVSFNEVCQYRLRKTN